MKIQGFYQNRSQNRSERRDVSQGQNRSHRSNRNVSRPTVIFLEPGQSALVVAVRRNRSR
jgi:hypothetical protein